MKEGGMEDWFIEKFIGKVKKEDQWKDIQAEQILKNDYWQYYYVLV